MKKPRHVPVRTCVACRTTDEKRDLLRVVRTPAGVQYDERGKVAGRGAYVCASASCIEIARKQRRFERALKVTATEPELFQALTGAAESRPVECTPGTP